MCAWADFACGTPPSSLLVPDVQQDKRYVYPIRTLLGDTTHLGDA